MLTKFAQFHLKFGRCNLHHVSHQMPDVYLLHVDVVIAFLTGSSRISTLISCQRNLGTKSAQRISDNPRRTPRIHPLSTMRKAALSLN